LKRPTNDKINISNFFNANSDFKIFIDKIQKTNFPVVNVLTKEKKLNDESVSLNDINDKNNTTENKACVTKFNNPYNESDDQNIKNENSNVNNNNNNNTKNNSNLTSGFKKRKVIDM
jgi:hypothetical protein